MRNIGKLGEQLVAYQLQMLGWRLLHHHATFRYGELDLVLLEQATLVGVEVKLRRSRRFGTPVESITQKKLQCMHVSLQQYMYNIGWIGPYRLDVVCVELLEKSVDFYHIRAVGEDLLD